MNKFEIVELIKYLQETSIEINADFQTYWLSTLYLRQSLAKGVLDPSKFILGSLVCLSLAVKFDECGQQMKYQDEINPNETLPQHRNSKHKAIYEKMMVIIMMEQQGGMLIN